MGISQGFVQEKQNVLKNVGTLEENKRYQTGSHCGFFFAWIAMLDKSNNNLAK